jgi:hypothetical protein
MICFSVKGPADISNQICSTCSDIDLFTSIGPLLASSLSPSCSWIAVKMEVWIERTVVVFVVGCQVATYSSLRRQSWDWAIHTRL